MAKWQQRIKPWFVNNLDLPSDTMLEMPRITAIGHLHVYIENHKGLVAFTDHELILKTQQGQIIIKGQSFVIKTMLSDELLLEGQIEHIQFDEEH